MENVAAFKKEFVEVKVNFIQAPEAKEENIIESLRTTGKSGAVEPLELFFKIPAASVSGYVPESETPTATVSKISSSFAWSGQVLLMSGAACELGNASFHTVADLQACIAALLDTTPSRIKLVSEMSNILPLTMKLPEPDANAPPIGVVTLAPQLVAEASLVEGIGKALVKKYYDLGPKVFSFYDHEESNPNELKLLEELKKTMWTVKLTLKETKKLVPPYCSAPAFEFNYEFSVVKQTPTKVETFNTSFNMCNMEGGHMRDIVDSPETEKCRADLIVPRKCSEFALARTVGVWIYSEEFCNWTEGVQSLKKVYVLYNRTPYKITLARRGRNLVARYVVDNGTNARPALERSGTTASSFSLFPRRGSSDSLASPRGPPERSGSLLQRTGTWLKRTLSVSL